MGAEVVVGIIGLVLMVATYFGGVHQGRRQERRQQLHDRAMEQDRRLHDLAQTMIEEYVRMARPAHDRGPHALSRLGLDQLGSDRLIRDAIGQMHARTAFDPWVQQARHVEDLDLVAFFRYVREKDINFFRTTVEAVANNVRALGHLRTER